MAAEKAVEKKDIEGNFAPKLSGKRVRIKIHKSGDKFAIDPVPLALNGHQITVRRGAEVDVPIEYIEVLNNAVTIDYSQVTLADGSAQMEPRESPSYPFQIVGMAA